MTPCPWLQVKILKIMQMFPLSEYENKNLIPKA
jgi:hypothetical protein